MDSKIPGFERKSERSKSDPSKRNLSLCYHKCVVISDTEPKRCRKAGCKNLIANACYLVSHSCESCVCTCLILCSMTTKLKVTSINTGKAVNDAEATEVPQVAPLSLDMIQEESPLPHDGDHLNKEAVSISSKKCDTRNEDKDAQSSNKQILTTPFDAAQEDITENHYLKVSNINADKAVNDTEATEVPQVAPLSLDMIQEESPLPHDGYHLNKAVSMSSKKCDTRNEDFYCDTLMSTLHIRPGGRKSFCHCHHNCDVTQVPAKDWVRCFSTSCNNHIAKGCHLKLHSCEECICPCGECAIAVSSTYNMGNDQHVMNVQSALHLLALPTVPILQKSLNSDAASSSITAETTYDGASMKEFAIDDEVILIEKADNDSIDEEATAHGYIVCSESTPNPTKNFNGLPFGDSKIIYDPLISKMQKINLFYSNEYCYKCYMNTGNAYLKHCSLCDQLSFIGCGAEGETLDEEFIPTGGPLFFCCYCNSLKRDLNKIFEHNEGGLYQIGDTIVKWAEHVARDDLFARNLYEKRIELGRTENEYSERLYGSSFDPSEELACNIFENYLEGEGPKEFACTNCGENHVDNIGNMEELCIDCAMENYYNSLDIEMKRDKRLIMNKRKYNLGFYPASENFLQLPYYHKIDNEDRHIYEEGYTTTYRGEMTKEDLMNFYFDNNFKGDKEECCSFTFRTDMSIKKSSKIQAYFIYDNTYSNPKRKNEIIDVYVQVVVPLKRKIAMIFHRSSGVSSYKLLLVPIIQYADMVKVGVLVPTEDLSYDSKAYQNRVLDLHTSGITKPTVIYEISSMYDNWTDDGRVIGCNPFYRHYLFNENNRIPDFVGDSFVAKAFRNGEVVHLFWEELSNFAFGELGFESMDTETFSKLLQIRMIQYKSPSNKTEERKTKSSRILLNAKEDKKLQEKKTQSSSAIQRDSYSSPVVSPTNSSQSNSLASSRTKVSPGNNNNESGSAVNVAGENPESYVLEPIANELNIKFAPVRLSNDLWVSKSFHSIESFEFCFLVHSTKDGSTRILQIGDLHSGRGFFACCGYHVDEPEEIRLFFSNEQFTKVTSINLKNYLRKDWSPTHKLDLQGKPNPILSTYLFTAMDSFAMAIKAPSRQSRTTIQISYPESRKHLTRFYDKAPDTMDKKKTPLKRSNSVSSSNVNSTATSKKSSTTKESTQSSILKAPRKRKIDKIEDEYVQPSSDMAVVLKGKNGSFSKVAKTTEPLNRQQQCNTGNESEQILLLMERVRILTEENAKRDKKVEEALKKKDDDERLRLKALAEKEMEEKAKREIEEAKRKREDDVKEREKKEIEEAKRKREDDMKEREKKEIEEAKRKREDDMKDKERIHMLYHTATEKLKKDYEEMLLRKEMELQLEKQRELEETERRLKNEKQEETRRLELLLDTQSKKNEELMASRLKALEEELKQKNSVEMEMQRNEAFRQRLLLEKEMEMQRNEALRQRLLLEKEQQRISDEADLALVAKRQALADKEFTRKKEEYEQMQKQKYEQKKEQEKEKRDQQLLYAKEDLSLNERSAALVENQKAADEKRKAAEHQRTQESRRY